MVNSLVYNIEFHKIVVLSLKYPKIKILLISEEFNFHNIVSNYYQKLYTNLKLVIP